MLDNFNEYIQYLLPAVLKRNKSKNQLLIFCRMMGDTFDDIKDAALRLRKESLIETCSNCMLEVAGQDRDMVQLKGETYDAYRKRLQMKAKIAEMAGTRQGLLYALDALGYSNCTIEPLYMTDTSRWAEININFLTGSVDEDRTIDFKCIVAEVMKVKRASTLPHYIFYYPAVNENEENADLKVIVHLTSYFFANGLYLDGTWNLDGTQVLDSKMNNVAAQSTNRFITENAEDIEGSVIVSHDLWFLDGTVPMDGSRMVDAWIREEALE